MNEMSCQGFGPHANTKNAEHLLPELTGVDSTLFAKMCCTNQNGPSKSLNLSCIPIPAMVGKCGSLRDSSKDWHRKICCQRCWTYSPVLISRSMVVMNPVLAAIKGGKKKHVCPLFLFCFSCKEIRLKLPDQAQLFSVSPISKPAGYQFVNLHRI